MQATDKHVFFHATTELDLEGLKPPFITSFKAYQKLFFMSVFIMTLDMNNATIMLHVYLYFLT